VLSVRYAFQLAYDGSRYFGFVRQPGLPTVEGELLKALRRCGLLAGLKEARYRVAARTDRGVSALGQVVALNTPKRPILSQLNACLPGDIVVLSAVRVKPSFDPRRQTMRKHYRYTCDAPRGFNLKRARAAARLLIGRHDFRNFCKRERGKPTAVELERASIRGGRVLTFDFTARAFLWQQVRRMVGALLAVGSGRLKIGDFRQMLGGRLDRSAAPAPPGGLVLMRVECRGLVNS